MDIRAEHLYRKSNTQQIQQQVDEIYKSITYKITEAHQAGWAEIKYDLPDTFQIGCLEPADAQLIIYSRLIELVEKNGLQVSLVRTPNGGSVLKVRWPSVLDPVEKQRMKNIIKKHLEIEM